MKESIHIFHQLLLLLCCVATFTILFVITLKILKQYSIFKGMTAVILALCISLLSVIGLSRSFIVTDVTCEAAENTYKIDFTIDIILLPYIAIGLAIFFAILFRFVVRKFWNRRNESPKEIPRRMR
jgi:NADH:ubiquinone oxidoreductase subunit 5 (subunit L)/multisubunit Na+/H+ antiporter MnhA subunit